MLSSQQSLLGGAKPKCVFSICPPQKHTKGPIRQCRTVATAKPRGGRGSARSPAAKASPKKKLPAESSATQPSTLQPSASQPSSQARQTEKQVDDAASTVKQGVDDAASTAKQVVDNLQSGAQDTRQSVRSGTRDTRAAVNEQAWETRQAVNEQADSLQDGVDAGADALKDAISDGTEAAQDAADDFQRRAAVAADRVEAGVQEASYNIQEGIEDVSDRLETAIDQAPEQVAGTVQQVVDTTAAGIRSAQQQLSELQKPGPSAPFQATALTSLEPSPFEGRPGPKPAEEKQAEYYKKRLLYCVSGLDRGFAANSSAVAEVEATVASLLSVSQPILLSWAPEKGKDTSSLAELNGTWRLIYSSAFAKGNVPSLPGYKLGQVYQAISAYASRLDNIVEFYSTVNLPQLPGLPRIDPIVTTASLKHYFEAIGGSTVQITFEDTEVKSTGGPNGILGRLPEISLPQLPEGLRPPRSSRASTFEVLFLDEELRVTRGARGELRAFLRT